MAGKKSNSFLNSIFLIVISILLASVAFLILANSGIVNKDPKANLSDWVSAVISSLAFVSGAIAVRLAYKSLQLTQNAEEGNLYLAMMGRYADTEMVRSLRLLSTFYEINQSNLSDGIRNWNKKRLTGDEDALKIDSARHRVKYFYRDLMQLVKAGYFSESLAKQICNTGGRHIFKNIILPMDKILNRFFFKGEFDPFEKIYAELDVEQEVIRPKLKKICLIPARINASRFDGKLLKKLIDPHKKIEKTVIRETYERMKSHNLFDDVVVVTNSREIETEIKECGGKVFFSNKNHESGTDRIAEAAETMDFDVVFNVQGDEPFIEKEPLESLCKLMENESSNLIVASLMKPLTEEKNIKSPDFVKVICSLSGRAISFSRNVIPFIKNQENTLRYFEHVGVYAFTKNALQTFSQLPHSPLEKAESVECLRFLEHDIPIKMVETNTFLLEIDTEEDLNNVNNLLRDGSISLV
jgi:3-deoxy-manno-octulosonate cytidylyltransferase (CMP-KDO synthetase)